MKNKKTGKTQVCQIKRKNTSLPNRRFKSEAV